MTSVVMKTFEYLLLERIQPIRAPGEATSVRAAEEQSVEVSKCASHQGLTLNKSKTEVVKFSSNTPSPEWNRSIWWDP